ncbi:MAG: hypothetical protein AAF790_07790 [Planctomycetota bacterium]
MTRLALAAALAAAASSAPAAIMTSVGDSAGFTAALPSPTIEDFEDEAQGVLDQGGVPVPFDGFKITANGTSTFADDFEIDEDPGSLSQILDLFLDPGNIPTFTLTFDSPILAFGADFTSPASGGGTVIEVDGEAIDLAALPGVAPALTTFVGFTSDTPVSSLVLSSPTLEFVSLDNIVLQAVPEPASFGLVAAAALIGVRVRRR